MVPIFLLFFTSLLALIVLLSKALHSRPKLNKILSEPAMILLIGLFCSFVVAHFYHEEEAEARDDDDEPAKDWTESVLSFPSNIFFMGLLPPIMFNSGYELQRELFYRHIKPILLFAAVGTTLSGFAAGFALYGCKYLGWIGVDFDPSLLELLTFGALIAATDTVSVLGVLQAKRVDPHLFSLVFGESALNDAVAIVLFRTLAEVLQNGIADSRDIVEAAGEFAFHFSIEALGSPILGIAFSFLTALVFKYGDLREHKILELSLYVLLMYIPFILAEVTFLSGIVTIFFTGISARRYIAPNVSDETKHNAEVIFKLTAYLAETCIFLELGLSVFGLSGSFNWRFIACAFVAALLGRAVSIYPISILFNLSLKEVVKDPLLDYSDDISVGSESSASTGSGYSVGTSSWSSKSKSSHHKKQRRHRSTPEKRKDKKIPTNFMHILWFAGLRGAVAYACARDFPDLYGNKDEFTAATMVIVLVTVIGMGGGTESMLNCLHIRMNVDETEYMKIWRTRRRLKGWFHDLGKSMPMLQRFHAEYALSLILSCLYTLRNCRIPLHLQSRCSNSRAR
jgi:sodium/hydrogen exchanger 8